MTVGSRVEIATLSRVSQQDIQQLVLKVSSSSGTSRFAGGVIHLETQAVKTSAD